MTVKYNPFTDMLDVVPSAGETVVAGGSNTQVQYNSGGYLGGDSAFTWDDTSNTLTVGGDIAITGTVDGVDLQTLNSQVQSNTARLVTLETYRRPVTTKVADYSALATDYTIVADGSSATVTVTLPASPTSGQIFNIACLDSTNAVTIDFNGKNFYDSSSNETLFKGENIKLHYDGTQWVTC